MTDTPSITPVQSRIVYVRAVDPRELPEAARAQIGDAEVWAIHDETGARLAITPDRGLAFSLALRNDLRPVSAH